MQCVLTRIRAERNYRDSRMDANNTTSQARNHSTPELSGCKNLAADYLPKFLKLAQRVKCIGGHKITLPDNTQFTQLTRNISGFKANRMKLVRWTLDDQALVHKHAAFTLFAPAGKADRAKQAVMQLAAAGVFDPAMLQSMHLEYMAKRGRSDYLNYVAEIIRPNVRFFKTKAERLLANYQSVVGLRDLVTERIVANDMAMDAPALLPEVNKLIQQTMSGMGPKAAAHLMRNLGLFADAYAFPIIDVHIHKVLDAYHLNHNSYKASEVSFRQLSKRIGIPAIMLDAYVWCMYSGNWNETGADFDNFRPDGV